jgi:threonine/homoserine/homoserine lactone efflux protein
MISTAGFGALVLAVPPLRWAIVFGGSAYLLWLAWRLSQSHNMAQANEGRLEVSFLQGVGLQFLNIKAWMMALSIVAGWIAGREDTAWRFWQVLPVLMTYAFFSNLAYASAGSLLRHWLTGPVIDGQPSARRLRRFNQTMAVALVLTAAWMLWNQSTFDPI